MSPRERLAAGIILTWVLLGLSLSALLLEPSAAASIEASGSDPTPNPAAMFVLASFPPAADAFIQQANPTRNFGLAEALVIGGDNGASTAYRSLLSFNLTGIPSLAAVQSATLRAYVVQGTPGQTVSTHRVRTSWLEGTGSQFGYYTPITITETAGVSRVREPVDVNFTVPVSLSSFVPSDFRVYDDQGREVPSQVYGTVFSGPFISRVHVVFGASVDASSSRVFNLYYGNAVPVAPPFRQGTLGTELWNFSAGAKYAALTAADLDGDGRLEIVFGSHDGHIYAVRSDGTEMWNYTASDIVEYFTTVVDVDGDGELEVLYATTGSSDFRIYALTASNATFEWSTQAFPTRALYSPVAVADVDGDGVKELFVGSQDKSLYAFNGSDGSVRWAIPLGGAAWGNAAAVGNLTGDATPEIVYATSTGDYHAVAADSSPVWTVSPGGNSNLVPPSIGDVDGDGVLDVVAGDNAVNGNEFAVNGSDGSMLWQLGTFSNQAGGQVLVDFEDDGRLETVFALTRRSEIGAVDYLGNLRWTRNVGDIIYSIPAAADVTMDGVEDILVGVGDPSNPINANLAILDRDGTILAQFASADAITATPVVADLDGDGTMEIVFASRTRTYAYSTGSLGHDYRTLGYNHRLTDRFLDGNSPDGLPFLTQSVGTVVNLGGSGVTWQSRNGTSNWASPGADYDALPLASVGVTGSATWLSWNLTGLVQDWVDGTQPNVGILLKAVNENSAALTTFGAREGDPAFDAVLDVV